ncbi:hypothetical protein BGX23_006117 [Mortierella sp. AD031]|nr:hypothetical protein BGX23_006117 [Mortierella sp. AD031]
MVKLAISAFLLAQFCILNTQASHYIQFRLTRQTTALHRAGTCIHDGKILMTDQDGFGSTIENYGFNKDGWFANVNWKNKEVDVQGWGRFKFQKTMDDKYTAIFDGFWDSSGGDCKGFKNQARYDCGGALNF